MSVKLLTEHHLDLLSLNGGCTGSSESTLVKIPHCWKSHKFYLYSVCLFVCFIALRPKSTAMVMAGRSINLTTLFPVQA